MSKVQRGSMSIEAMLVMSVLLVLLGIIVMLFNKGYLMAKVEAEDRYQEAFLEKIDGLRFEQLMKL